MQPPAPVAHPSLGTSIAEEVKALLLPELMRSYALARANDMASLINVSGAKLQSDTMPLPQRVVTRHLQPGRLVDLRTFLHDSSAMFKTPQQAEAVEILASDISSLLVVGPTGMKLFAGTGSIS